MSNITIIPFLNRVVNLIINPIIVFLFLLGTAYLLFSFIKFLSLEPGDKSRDEAWSSILWGLTGLAIMFSVYGIIQLVLSVFGINSSDIGSPGVLRYIGL
ncbi:MAG TPA: hypothetical protein PLZ99_02490 [Parcubacteria group bacterium]|jgi:hypothetical protein|nr:hypothetical protein [Parcubacteria group bacterium]